MLITYLCGCKMPSFCFHTGHEALCKIFCNDANLFIAYFVPLLKKGASQSLQISVGFEHALASKIDQTLYCIKVRAVVRHSWGVMKPGKCVEIQC